MTQQSPARAGRFVETGGFRTHVQEAGAGEPVVLVHGSGPGVSAYANWRLTIPELAAGMHVVAPDMVGFGSTDRPEGVTYDLTSWVRQVLDLMDALGLARASIVGNSFGGAIALRLAATHPERVDRLVLMGSVGVPFDITAGLDAVWGYQPSVKNMRALLDIFAYSRELVTDELAQLRYEASIQPGYQESFASMFPAPRQRWVDAMVTSDELIAALDHETLVIHGREDRVIPLSTSLRLLELIPHAQLHVFGRCGHWTQIERHGEFNALLRGFLSPR